MKPTPFFAIAIIFLAVPRTQIASAVETLSPTKTAARTSTPSSPTGNSPISDGITIKPTILISQQSPRPRRIQFAQGASSGAVEGAVVRGTRDVYLLRARGNQKMTVNITSLEQNAVFDIQAPNGKFLQQEATTWSGVLPSYGDYSVIVGGTRGNATYRLEVTIK